MAKLEYKLEITGTIEVVTGLHIGGSDVDMNIGGIDSEVAKDKDGNPYIPGSSIGGKIRNLIANIKGYKYLDYDAANRARDTHNNWDQGALSLLFSGETNSRNRVSPTRLLIRDAMLIEDDTKEIILEDKAENVINRITGVAKPRHIERVVSGTKFQLKMMLDIYEFDDIKDLCETLHLGINLLNNDYLGGMGSRGSGEVKVTIENVEKLEFVNGTINRTKFNEYSFKD